MQNIGRIAFFLILIIPLGSRSQAVQGNLLYNWKSDTLKGSDRYNNTYNEVWGLSVNDHEYGIIGSVAGTHFIDITNPDQATETFFVKGASSGSHIIHRDYHDYKGYLYTLSDEDTANDKGALQIIDISNLPESIEVVYESSDRIRMAHNLFIDSSRAILYLLSAKGGEITYSALRLYDISNPINPILIKAFNNNIAGINISHVHDAYVQDGIAFLHCGYDGFIIADFKDPNNPEILTHLQGTDYPQSGYNHSGWISQLQDYYFFADENLGSSLKVLDISDKSNVITTGTFDADYPNGNQSIAHNPIVLCDYLFVSYYYDGLQVYDIKDPSNPERVLYYPTSNLQNRDNYEGAWGVFPFLPSGNILVSDMQNGLFVIEKFTDYCQLTSVVDDEPIFDVKVFPNPSNGTIFFKTDAKINGIVLFNISGQKIYEVHELPSKTLNLTNLTNGLYFLNFNIDGHLFSEKIIIQH